MNWMADKRWSDKFLPEIKSILGQQLIGEPPVEEDQERNTDLIVLKMEPVRICCRIRRHKYIDKYDEFTIRTGRPNGNKTELAKIIEGFGNYIFYGICDYDEQILECWMLGDLNVFRLWFNRQLVINKGKAPGISMDNKDGSSSFRVFKIDEIADDFVIARKHLNDFYQEELFQYI